MRVRKTVVIDAACFSAQGELLAYLASELDFPPYFGGNLSAFADCLGDVSAPTNLAVVALPKELPRWLQKALVVMRRVSAENPSLRMVEHRAGRGQ